MDNLLDNYAAAEFANPNGRIMAEACCAACADTNRKVSELYDLFKRAEVTPMGRMLMGKVTGKNGR